MTEDRGHSLHGFSSPWVMYMDKYEESFARAKGNVAVFATVMGSVYCETMPKVVLGLPQKSKDA